MRFKDRIEKVGTIYLILLGLVLLIAIIDSFQIKAFFELNTPEAWKLYAQYTLKSFIWLWVIIMAVPAIVYYLFTKDKSEGIGIFLSGLTLIFFGVEDLLYYIVSSAKMSDGLCWMNDYGMLVAQISHWFGEACTTPSILIIYSIVGLGISYLILKLFSEIKWLR